jgi:hypothetical protein
MTLSLHADARPERAADKFIWQRRRVYPLIQRKRRVSQLCHSIKRWSPSPNRCGRWVEALVKSMAVFLSGLIATLAGAFIRSCSEGPLAALAHAWCGNAPLLSLSDAGHQHCPGCALTVAGLVLIAFSPFLALTPVAAKIK